MNRITYVLAVGTVALLSSCTTNEPSQSAQRPNLYHTPPKQALAEPATARAVEPVDWPRTIASGAVTNIIYQPQVDSWDGHRLTGRNAVGIQSGGQTTYGVVTIQAVTLVDKARRTVSLEDIQILGGDFPSAQQKAPEFLTMLRQSFSKGLAPLSLDSLENSFTAGAEQFKGSGELNNTPPKIIFAMQAAILVYIDGPPVYRPMAGTELERVINTRALVLKDKSGQLYVHVFDGYMKAPNLEGPWVVAEAPKGAAEAEKEAGALATPADLLEASADTATNRPASLTNASPTIYVETKPAELIVFDGQPDFLPIAGTRLLYAANTSANVFKLLTDQQTYVLISGRWFRGRGLEGPWEFVAANRLAPDFANIPDNSPKENVKASVPATQQATEALIANSIPQSDKLPRTAQIPKPQIDGAPRLQAIAGTPLFYVANSATPIIKVDDHSWYACENGAWYAATSVEGPWVVAASVPAVIYSIPPSCPLHYVTYVRVYGSSPQNVYVGYTPGYLGAEVQDGVVVYGTGYYYDPWINEYWYGYPVTWGFGWGPCWTPWYDWCYGFGFGYGYSVACRPCHPWWGPWCGRRGIVAVRTGAISTAANVYRPRVTGTTAGVRPVSRTQPGAYARAYNSRTGGLAGGQRASVQNVYDSPQARTVRSPYWGNRQVEGRGYSRGNAAYGRSSGVPRSPSLNDGPGRRGSSDGSYGARSSSRGSEGSASRGSSSSSGSRGDSGRSGGDSGRSSGGDRSGNSGGDRGGDRGGNSGGRGGGNRP